jgi:hypothetical protein
MQASVLRKVLGALEREGVRYAIFGAMAMAVHGLPRATEDLDIFVEPTPANLDRLRRALASVFDDPEIVEISDTDLLGDYPAVQYVPPGDDFHIDILTRLGEAYTFDSVDKERVAFGDLEVTTVTARQLFEMKNGTVRPKDHADAFALRQRFGWKD